jgi:hypothetical protein
MDLRVDRTVLYDKFASNLYAELENATSNQQVHSITEGSPGILLQHRWQIVLPSIGVGAEF